MRKLPFATNSFDAVVSIHVLYHASASGLRRAVDEASRVLRPSGTFIGTLLSKRTWKFGEGEEIEPGTFVQARGPEAGVPHSYVDEAGARALFSGFDLESLDHEEWRDENDAVHAHWNIVARRRP
jgi:SAM-dependent methyltransferase